MPSSGFGSVEQYVRAFSALARAGMSPNHRRLLCAHYLAPNHTATRADLAQAVGYSSLRVVNMQYGRFAHRVALQLGITKAPTSPHFRGPWWGYVIEDFATERGTDGHTAYVLRSPVVSALEHLTWVGKAGTSAATQTRPPSLRAQPEGNEFPTRADLVVSRVLRDSAVIRALKTVYKDSCQRCGARLELDRTAAYSEAHHLRPLGPPHNGPDTRANIVVLCPNCHVLLDHGSVTLERSQLTMDPTHRLSQSFIRYHNKLARARGMPPNKDLQPSAAGRKALHRRG